MRKEPGLPMPDNNEKLVKMLKYVSEHNDFYKKRIKEYGISNPLDITQWPILSREDVLSNMHLLLSDKYHGRLFDDLMVKKTSGTSGIPVTIYWNKQDFYRSTISSWRLRKLYYSITPISRQVNFNNQIFTEIDMDNSIIFNETKNSISFNKSSIKNNYRSLFDKIYQFNPEWIYTTPYILEQLIEFSKKNNLNPPHNLKYVECAGEVLLNNLKEEAFDLFRIVVSNMYGTEETNGIAFECPFGNMHIMDDNVFVECISNNKSTLKGLGEAVVTSLHNYAMPLIRYALNDVIIIDNSLSCPCGNPHHIIKEIRGRTNEVFSYNNVMTSGYDLVEAINILNNMLGNPVEKFSFEYDSCKQTLIIRLKIQVKFQSQVDEVKQKLFSILRRRNIFAKKVLILNEKVWPNHDIQEKQRILYIK